MPYCTQADIINLELTEKELIQLTDDPGLGSVTTAMVTAAITKADAEIDGYCQAKYTVPFNPVPEIVKGWSATLAAFNLFRNRAKPATILDRYNKVMSWLSNVSSGKMSIPGVTDSSSLPGSTTLYADPVFKRGTFRAASVVLGSDNKTYTCIAAHTSAASNKPITGADYASYWTEGGINGETWTSGENYIPADSVVAEFGTMEVW